MMSILVSASRMANRSAFAYLQSVALGRRNGFYLGDKSTGRTGPTLTAIIPILETCRRQGINLRKYLGNALPRLWDWPMNCVAGAVPWPKSSPPPPVKRPARKWRDLARQAWHADPLLCPDCLEQIRLIAVIDDPPVVEKILRHLNLWCGPAHFAPARPLPSADSLELDPDFPIDSDPLPDSEDVISD